MDARPRDVGLRVVLTQRDRLVEIGECFRPCLLIDPQAGARGQHRRVLRFKFERMVIVGQRCIEIASALMRIGTR
jgi:hypothetical protein